METQAGIKLTDKQIKNVKAMQKLLSKWDKDLCINCIAGKFHIMLKGNTKQNPIPELSNTGGFNHQNEIWGTTEIYADGGDW